MLKSLNIDYYLDGYNGGYTNCIDMPIAGAAGHYNYDNYYYYCFYYAVLSNWYNASHLGWSDFRNHILCKLGLVIKSNMVFNSLELISTIKACIDKQSPIIMPVKYNTLFYDIRYLNHDFNSSHVLVVSGYDPDKSLIVIRDYAHVEDIVRLIKRGGSLCKLQITENMVSDIWIRSNMAFKIDEDSLFHNNIFSIEKTHEPLINSYGELLKDFVYSYNPDYNNLIHFLDDYSNKFTDLKDVNYAESVRRTYYRSVVVMFDIFEKLFNYIKLDDSKKEFLKFKEEYLEFRNILISKLIASALRNKQLQYYDLDDLKSKVKAMDNRLFLIVNELYLQYADTRCEKGEQVNFAQNSNVSADTEYFPASHTVDGKWANQIEHAWVSGGDDKVHWLIVDIGVPRTINKFVIRHIGDQEYNTRDFKVQGSNDGCIWTDLVLVIENTKAITEHEIESNTYRYFRLYITNPAHSDYYARIYEFEIWGDK